MIVDSDDFIGRDVALVYKTAIRLIPSSKCSFVDKLLIYFNYLSLKLSSQWPGNTHGIWMFT